MKIFVVRDKHGELYASLREFSRPDKNSDWTGFGVLKVDDTDIPDSELISFTDDNQSIREIMIASINGAFTITSEIADTSINIIKGQQYMTADNVEVTIEEETDSQETPHEPDEIHVEKKDKKSCSLVHKIKSWF